MNKKLWLLPALASALFFAFSLRVLLTDRSTRFGGSAHAQQLDTSDHD